MRSNSEVVDTQPFNVSNQVDNNEDVLQAIVQDKKVDAGPKALKEKKINQERKIKVVKISEIFKT